MRITRPNMADLARTFSSSGESDSKEVPEVSIDMPASITPTMEFCRAVSRSTAAAAAGTPMDESVYEAYNIPLGAGGGTLSALQFTLRRGMWRLSFQGCLATVGAIPTADNHAILALVGPDTLFGPGMHLLQSAIGSIAGGNDFLIHIPTDEWGISLELTDPVTALATNIFRGSVYACHLL